MERCNARTLEIFRRMGIADRVRAAGYPTAYRWTSITSPRWWSRRWRACRTRRSTRLRAEAARRNDGVMPLEPYQLISQYTLEPLLKAIDEENPLIDVRFGHELVSFEQDADGVTAHVRTTAGDDLTFRSRTWSAATAAPARCASSSGIALDGRGNIR